MQRKIGAPAGRGAYQEVTEVMRLVEQTRQQIADLINAPRRQNIAFTYSGTDALCTAIFGILQDDDHVVTCTAEHNSVLRPLRHLEHQNRVSVTRVPCDSTGRFTAQDVIAAIRPETKLVALTHVSNVTGAIQPIQAVGRHCQQHRIAFLIDAAQSLGHLPIDVQRLGCQLLAAPGHKGLFGPLGTGVLYVADEIAERMTPFRFGGTGSMGADDEQPSQVPEKFEAGNLNVPGIAGIHAGIEFLRSSEGQDRIELSQENERYFLAGVSNLQGVSLQGPVNADERIGIFSLTMDGYDCLDAAATLDANWSIQGRAGFHCAPLLHRALGSADSGGTLRLSLGLFNTRQQIDRTLDALQEMTR